MKKTTIITVLIIAALLISSCGTAGAPATPSVPDNAPTKTNGQVQDTQPPVEQVVSDGTKKVSVKFEKTFEQHFAPDVSDFSLLSFSYYTPKVRIDNNDESADKINEALALTNEFFYSGSDKYPGVSAYHEMALDTYTYARDNGQSVSADMYATRKAAASRCDNNAISIRFTVSSFTGGTSEEFYYEGMSFDTKTGTTLQLSDVVTDINAFEKVFSAACTKYQESTQSGLMLGDTIYNGGTSAKTFLTETEWYLTDDGIVIIIDSADVRAKVFSPIELLIGYGEIKDSLNQNYAPEIMNTTGSLSIRNLDAAENVSIEISDRIVCDDNGKEILLSANGVVSEVAIYRVVYSGDTFYKTDAIWYSNAMSNSAIQLSAAIPEGIPSIMICSRNADGTLSESFLTTSGNDGSLILSDRIEFVG